MSPEIVVVVSGGAKLQLALLDRRTGAVRVGLDGVIIDFGALAIANDVIYDYHWALPERFRETGEMEGWEDNRLRATEVSGEPLWELPFEVLGSAVMGLAPMPQRLYGLTQSNAVFCLES